MYSVLTSVEMYQLRLVAVIPSIHLSSLHSKIRSEKKKTCLIFYTRKGVDNIVTPLNTGLNSQRTVTCIYIALYTHVYPRMYNGPLLIISTISDIDIVTT